MNTTQQGVDVAAELEAQNQRITEAAAGSGGAAVDIDPDITEANAEADENSAQEQTGARQESERERVIREIAERRMATLNVEESEFTEQAGNQTGVAEVDNRTPSVQAGQMVKIKVDGVETMVPLSEVIEQGTRTLQKESAADKRLKEAAEMRQAAELRAQQVEQLARQLQAKQEQDQGQQLSQKDASDLKQQARGFMEKFMEGDEEAAIDALAGLIGRGNATHDPRAMIEQATLAAQQEVQRAETARFQRETDALHATAKAEFTVNFKEIVSDPKLYQLADMETLNVLKDHPEWDASRDIGKILKEAGTRVREWHGKTPTTSKRELKQGLSKPITGTSSRMAGAPESKPKTTAQVIADQRRARGLPVY